MWTSLCPKNCFVLNCFNHTYIIWSLWKSVLNIIRTNLLKGSQETNLRRLLCFTSHLERRLLCNVLYCYGRTVIWSFLLISFFWICNLSLSLYVSVKCLWITWLDYWLHLNWELRLSYFFLFKRSVCFTTTLNISFIWIEETSYLSKSWFPTDCKS